MPAPHDDDRIPMAARAGVVLLVVVAVGLRLWTTSPLWLDEAISVNIADAGFGELRSLLERDGAPPLYYVLLAGWVEVFGTGDVAVRLLSAVFSIATFAVVYRMGRRKGGPLVGIAALVLFASSPFAIRYATEARMYSLQALLVGLGWLAIVNALDRPSFPWLAAAGATTGAVLLTHYWGFYLVAVTGLALVVTAVVRPARRRAATRIVIAMGLGGGAIFGPWLPTFVSQLQHTGTPWGLPPGPVFVLSTTLFDFAGGPRTEGMVLRTTLAGLLVLALLARAVDRSRIELDLRTRPGIRAEAAVVLMTLLLGTAVGLVSGGAWASRYASVVLVLVLLVAAYGTRALQDRRIVAAVLALVAVLGFAGGVRNALTDRTQAEQAADAIVAAGARPGDIVVYCPDQLGPDVHRVLPDGFNQFTFPAFGDPRYVDWVDYEERNEAADEERFARQALRRAEGRNLFYVWMPGYRTLGDSCERMNDVFGNARPGNDRLLVPDSDIFESHVVWLHPAPGRSR